ncbi:hypothetical protein GQ457_08G000760 [Hibiscus cannabinus]
MTWWQPPHAGWVKLNTDGLRCRISRCASCCGIIRDKSGVRIMGYSRFIGVCSTFDEKLLGVLDGLNTLLCLGYRIVVIELDSLAAVCILKGSVNASAHSYLL